MMPGLLKSREINIRIVGPAYAFLGIGLVLYFASQGAGTMRWPIRAQILRFVHVGRRRVFSWSIIWAMA